MSETNVPSQAPSQPPELPTTLAALSETLVNPQTEEPPLPSPTAKLSTNKDLALALGLKNAKTLTWLSTDKSSHYTIHRIPKRASGKFRTIHNPDQQMRIYQNKILNGILADFDLPDYLWAFEAGRSIPQMAELHVNKEVVISFDIKDFFTSITQKDIQGVFAKYGIEGMASRTLSELCTYKFFVPQGAITSPKISNIIAANTFGPSIKQYCDDQGLSMTIYADDITISSVGRMEWDAINAVREVVASELTKHNFKLNRKKTKVMFRSRRQWVCGAVVNDKVNMLRKEREKLRAIVFNVCTNGLEAEAAKNNIPAEMFERQLKGKLNWYRQLNPERGNRLYQRLETALQVAAGDPLSV